MSDAPIQREASGLRAIYRRSLLARLNKLAGTDKPEIFIMPAIAGQRGSGRRGLSETFKKSCGRRAWIHRQ
jgi:hypothetical protein